MSDRPPRRLPTIGGEDPGSAEDPQSDPRVEALAPMVRSEAHRVLGESEILPDPARIAAGWERRFVAEGERADEMIELYRELGYEVAADPVRPQDLAEGCADCFLAAALRFRSIYTRRPSPGDEDR